MPYSVSLNKVSRSGLLAAVVHSTVVGIPIILSIYYENSTSITLDYFAILVIVATVPLYIVTGIPNVIRDNCRNCGELMNLGKAYCDNCGDKLQSNPGGQILWFVLGHSILITLFGMTLVAYIIELIMHPENTPLPLGGYVILIVVFLYATIYSLSLFIIYQSLSHTYVSTKENISCIQRD